MTTTSNPARIAIVTGAAKGIGYAIACRLADDGLDVAINDIASKTERLKEVVKEIQAKGRKCIAVPGDVSNEDDMKSMVEKTVQELGGVDCMIANAGICVLAPFLDSTVEELERSHAVNVRGTMLCFKYAAAQMVKQGRGGRLVAASSTSGRDGQGGLSAYCATKFAIRGLTQAVAIEMIKHDITANAYAPGIINTGIEVQNNLPNGMEGVAEIAKNMFAIPPYVKRAEPDVIASIVSYLCKPEAYFITGQTISVDGGWKLS